MSEQSNWQWTNAASMHRRFAVGRDGKTAYERNVGMRVGHLWDSSVSEYGGCLCSHATVLWVHWIHDLNKEGTWGRWMHRTQCLLALPVDW